jgi:hypothetical protein
MYAPLKSMPVAPYLRRLLALGALVSRTALGNTG